MTKKPIQGYTHRINPCKSKAMLKAILVLSSFILLDPPVNLAQITPDLTYGKDSNLLINEPVVVKHRVPFKSYIVPAVLISYGFASLASRPMQNLDKELQEEVWQEHPHQLFKLDDYLRYAPAVMVYGLNVAGVKGKNTLLDRSMIYLISNTVMGVTVQSLKSITRESRPDGSGSNSFPSGHTATAFASAEFLRQEYKDISPWYGIAGYAMATATAYLRMYNNKHWFRDLAPGAGIGILSTDLAYWIYPSIKKVFSKKKPMNTMVMPYYEPGGGGIRLVKNF